MSGNQLLRIGAAITIAIGAFLPWVQILGIGIAGTNGDGKITLVIGIAIGAASLTPKRWAAILTAIGGGLCAVVAFADMTNVAGSGIYLTLAGGLIATAAGIIAARRPSTPTAAPST